MKDTKHTSFRLSSHSLALLAEIAKIDKRSQAATLEKWIEDEAEKRGIKLKRKKQEAK